MSIDEQIRNPFVDGEPPTRARFIVIAFLCALAFVLYLDRICISQAMPVIQMEFQLTNTHVSFVLAAFTLAYGLFEVPTGHWADRIGSRAVLTRISIWWSAFTALTAASQGFSSLLVIRFLFGAGEAGAFPNAARIFSRWLPVNERGRAQGLLQTTALIGGAAAPVLSAYLIRTVGWRPTFVIFGLTGVIWAVAFYSWFRDDPHQHPAANDAERQHIGPIRSVKSEHESIPWGSVFSSSCILLLGLIMTCASFNSYVYFSWFPTYLQKARAVDPQMAGLLSSMVLGLSAIGNLGGGVLADLIARSSQNRMRARRTICCFAYVVAAMLLAIGISCESAVATAFFAGVATMATHATIATWWSCAIEVSGKHVGALFGLMNGIGGFGAMGSQFFFGVFADWRREHGFTGRDQWDPAFYVVVGVLLVAAVAWLWIDSSKPVDTVDDPASIKT